MKPVLLVVALVVGVAAGAGASWLVAGPGPAPKEAPRAQGPSDREAALEEEIARLRRELAEARTAAAPANPAPGATAAAPAPTRHADPVVAARASKIREQAAETAAKAEVLAIHQVAAERRVEEERRQEEARRIEDLARGGTMEFLRGLKADWVAPWDTLSSSDSFGKLFARATEGATYEIGRVSLAQPLPDGSTLVLPAGKVQLDFGTIGGWRQFPADLVIAGQGMDATLVERSDYLRARGEVRSLTLRDLTIGVPSNSLCDFEKPFTLRLERCRVIGFDTGAGGSVMVYGNSGAFFAEDCRFEGGFGRNPEGYANLFRVGDGFLARLDRCVLRGPLTSVYGSDKGAYLFRDCRFLEMRHDIKGHLEGGAERVRFEECSFEYMPADYRVPKEPRSVAEINPAWADPKKK